MDLQGSDFICAASVGKLQCPRQEARRALGLGLCTQPPSSYGCMRASWRSAFHACTMVGARLCRAAELQNNEASGTGCGLNAGLAKYYSKGHHSTVVVKNIVHAHTCVIQWSRGGYHRLGGFGNARACNVL